MVSMKVTIKIKIFNIRRNSKKVTLKAPFYNLAAVETVSHLDPLP